MDEGREDHGFPFDFDDDLDVAVSKDELRDSLARMVARGPDEIELGYEDAERRAMLDARVQRLLDLLEPRLVHDAEAREQQRDGARGAGADRRKLREDDLPIVRKMLAVRWRNHPEKTWHQLADECGRECNPPVDGRTVRRYISRDEILSLR